MCESQGRRSWHSNRVPDTQTCSEPLRTWGPLLPVTYLPLRSPALPRDNEDFISFQTSHTCPIGQRPFTPRGLSLPAASRTPNHHCQHLAMITHCSGVKAPKMESLISDPHPCGAGRLWAAHTGTSEMRAITQWKRTFRFPALRRHLPRNSSVSGSDTRDRKRATKDLAEAATNVPFFSSNTIPPASYAITSLLAFPE